jgi:hypothetical protein
MQSGAGKSDDGSDGFVLSVYNCAPDESELSVMAASVNVEIYQVMAEILITARRIVHRGLIKVSGPNWYEDGCPSSVFDRLVARKENELAIERTDREYHELIGYASLDDLAEIIEHNADLANLLRVIAPKGSTIVAMFREIEALRLKLAAAAPFSDDDAETLYRYHADFRDALDRRMKEKGQRSTSVASPVETDPVIHLPDEPKDETVDDGRDEAASADRPEVEDEAPESDWPLKEEVAEAAPVEEAEKEPVEADRPEQKEEDYITAVTGSDTAEIELAEVGRALADRDDLEVLRVIRNEVMAVAEGVLQNDHDRATLVWEEVCTAGWYERKKTDLEIVTLEEFYSVVDAVRETHRSGGGLESIKAHLQVSEFSKLLLALREMFLKHGI